MIDAWKPWRVICLSLLSVEDVAEDVEEVLKVIGKLKELNKGLDRAAATQSYSRNEQGSRLDAVSGNLAGGLICRVSSNMGKLSEQLGGN